MHDELNVDSDVVICTARSDSCMCAAAIQGPTIASCESD